MYFDAYNKNNRLVGECETLECFKCKKIYIPTKEDISTKNLNVYWKNCSECRRYMREACKKSFDKKNKN